MKLWLDDIRPAPEGWVWARTVDEAIEALNTGIVVECSLDHDLGLHTIGEAPDELDEEYWDKVVEITNALSPANAETGMDLVEWMLKHNRVPGIITIHSWNPDGAMRMARRFADNGHECVVQPFRR